MTLTERMKEAGFDELSTQEMVDAVVEGFGAALEAILVAIVADETFEGDVETALGNGVALQVGEQKFRALIVRDGNVAAHLNRIVQAAVIAARDECETQARRFEERMPDGAPVWADPERSAQIARHCAAYVSLMAPAKPYEILNELELLRKRDVRWRAAAAKLLALDLAGSRRTLNDLFEDVIDVPEADLSELGLERRGLARQLLDLMKGG